MAAQVVAIALVIGSIRWTWLSEPAIIGMWVVMLFGIVSAADYFRTFWRRVDDSGEAPQTPRIASPGAQEEAHRYGVGAACLSTSNSSPRD